MDRTEILKSIMQEKGMEVSDVAREADIPYTSVKSILERGIEKASYINICKICLALGTTPDELEKLAKSNIINNEFISLEDKQILDSLHKLDDLGRKHILYELNRESSRMSALKEQADRIKELETILHQSSKINRIYPYLHKIACAGTGFYFDDIPSDTIEAPYVEGADFIIGVSGDSMEPDYHDGDKLYVKKTEHLAIGDTGIFTIGNECYLKELGPDGLISRNPAYENIPGTEDIRLIGKVIGRISDD